MEEDQYKIRELFLRNKRLTEKGNKSNSMPTRLNFLTEKCKNCGELYGYVVNDSTWCALIDLHKLWTAKELIKKGVCEKWKDRKGFEYIYIDEHVRLIAEELGWYTDWYHHSYPSSKMTLYWWITYRNRLTRVVDWHPEKNIGDCEDIKELLFKRNLIIETSLSKEKTSVTILPKSGKQFIGVNKSEAKAFLDAVVNYLLYKNRNKPNLYT